MDGVSGCLELAALNLEISLAYLKDTEDEFADVVAKLEYCLKLITELKQSELFPWHLQYLDSREYVGLN